MINRDKLVEAINRRIQYAVNMPHNVDACELEKLAYLADQINKGHVLRKEAEAK